MGKLTQFTEPALADELPEFEPIVSQPRRTARTSAPLLTVEDLLPAVRRILLDVAKKGRGFIAAQQIAQRLPLFLQNQLIGAGCENASVLATQAADLLVKMGAAERAELDIHHDCYFTVAGHVLVPSDDPIPLYRLKQRSL